MSKNQQEVQIDESVRMLIDFNSYPIQPSSNGINEIEFESLPTKSAKIRYLDSKGMSRAAIAKKMNIIYQHVRNVLEQQKIKNT